MPNIPISSSLGFIGVFLVVLGAFLILSGLDVLRIEKLTAKPGKRTWGIGLITVAAGILFLWMDIVDPFNPETKIAEEQQVSAQSANTAPATTDTVPAQAATTASAATDTVPVANTSFDGCFEEFFDGVSDDRITSLEAGSRDITLIGAEQSKSETFGIQFTDNSEPIGAIRVNFFPDGKLFKIEALVDQTCTQVSYSNVDNPGELVLQNWDTMEFQFQEQTYMLSLGGDVDIGATRFVRVAQ